MSEESKIPIPGGFSLRRSASVRVRGERSLTQAPFPAIGETSELQCNGGTTRHKKPCNKLFRSTSQASGLNRDDDLDSVRSFGSGISNLSTVSNCEHACFAKNGTTFSGRSMKYIVHCQHHENDTENYLTPTQRANKKIKQLKSLLQLAKEKLLEKEREIFKLTKEVVELRLFKATLKTSPDLSDLNSPNDNTTIDKSLVTHLELNSTVNDKDFCVDTSTDLSPIKSSYCFDVTGSREKINFTPDFLLSSLADSGHYEDLASSLSLHSKDSVGCWDKTRPSSSEPRLKGDDVKLTEFYEAKLEERRQEYQRELTELLKLKEEENLNLLNEFDAKIKDEQMKYENKFRTLLKTTEEEKLEIVEGFEKKLEEAKGKYLNHNYNEKQLQTDQSYVDVVDGEKKKYEVAVEEMKLNFEKEKDKLEKLYDDSMNVERNKFENVVKEIQARSDAKVKELLQKIFHSEKRFAELEPEYEAAKKRILELEKENEAMKLLLAEQEEKNKKMYLRMFMQGQEAARQQSEEVGASAQPSMGVSVPELLVQLQITETELSNLKQKNPSGVCLLSAKEAVSLWMLAARKAMYSRLVETQSQTRKQIHDNDPEATLQFLKSAVYYFLTDKDNQGEHLRAIENILGYSQTERNNIEKLCLG